MNAVYNGISHGQAGILPMKHGHFQGWQPPLGKVRRAVEKVVTEMNRTDGIYFEQRVPWRKFLGGMLWEVLGRFLFETVGN